MSPTPSPLSTVLRAHAQRFDLDTCPIGGDPPDSRASEPAAHEETPAGTYGPEALRAMVLSRLDTSVKVTTTMHPGSGL